METKTLGRNQKIGIGMFGAVFAASIPLVACGIITGSEWCTFALSLSQWGGGIILGSSMVIKAVEAAKS